MDWYSFFNLANIFNCIFGVSYLGIIVWMLNRFTKKEVRLSIGKFEIRKCDFNVQTVTNIVSITFYNGGQVPDKIRKEIIELTTPKAKKIVRFSK